MEVVQLTDSRIKTLSSSVNKRQLFFQGDVGITVTLVTIEFFVFDTEAKLWSLKARSLSPPKNNRQIFIGMGGSVKHNYVHTIPSDIVLLDHTFCGHCKIEIRTSQQNNG